MEFVFEYPSNLIGTVDDNLLNTFLPSGLTADKCSATYFFDCTNEYITKITFYFYVGVWEIQDLNNNYILWTDFRDVLRRNSSNYNYVRSFYKPRI